MKRIFLFFQIAFCCLFCWNYTAFAYNDSTSFDPTEASIKPKAIGGVPVGTIVAWPISKNPEDMENWLECNGQTISQTVYPELFALLGSRVPDYRGLFLRGLGSQVHAQNNGSTVGVTSTTHSSAALGQVQGDAVRNITGKLERLPAITTEDGYTLGSNGLPRGYGAFHWGGKGYYITNATAYPTMKGFGYPSMNASFVVPTASENRPINTSVRYFVRSRP